MTPPSSFFRAARRANVRARILRHSLTVATVAVIAAGAWLPPQTVTSPIPVAGAIAAPPPPQFAAALPGPAPAGTAAGPSVMPPRPREEEPAAPADAADAASLAGPAQTGTVPSAPPVQAPPSAPGGGAAPLAATGHRIAIDTSGYQAEVDRCLWVRMDIGAIAPIVGAHNVCGGDIVLALHPGDQVALAGQGLDGDYTVTGSRHAYAGDDAATTTAGLTATVILQTCYWDARDGVRLVTLVPVNAPTPTGTAANGGRA